MYYFELLLNQDSVNKEDWHTIHLAIAQQVGLLNEFQLFVKFDDNTVRFIIASYRNIEPLSNKLKIGVLQKVEESEVLIDKESSKERIIPLQSGESLLDLKERVNIKKSRDLILARLAIRNINSTKSLTTLSLYFKGPGGDISVNKRRLTIFPAHLLAIDFKTSTKYFKNKLKTYLDIQKSMHIMQSENLDALFETHTFPYLPKNYYLNLASYDFDKHSLIVGASGTGKSQLISLITDKIASNQMLQNEYSVIIIDPHAHLASGLSSVPNSINVDFKDDAQETQLFSSSDTDIQAATELTSGLFKSLLHDQHNSHLERVIKNSIYALITAQVMSLDNLKKFVTDIEYRNQLIGHIKDHVPETITHFFGTDFNEIRAQRYNEAISPIVSFVEEIQLQPALSRSSDNEDESIPNLVNQHSATIFSLNKISMGEKVVKTVAGLLIQQIFLLAQARKFNKKVILVIDELSVVQNPTIASILSEARKFNLSVILTQQYFEQVDKSLQSSIFANIINYYIFKVSEDDAKVLAGNLAIEIPKEILEAEKDKGNKQKEIELKLLTDLNPRELILRVSSGGQILPAFKASTTDFARAQPEAKGAEDLSAEPKDRPLQQPIKLAKFVEQPTASQSNLRTSPTLEEPGKEESHTVPTEIASQIIETAQSTVYTHTQPPQKKVSMSIQELLASQSSTRKK